MSDLLINSLMAEGSLELALETAIDNEIKEGAGENDKEKTTESKDVIADVPLLHLTQQLLKTSSTQVLSEFQQLFLKPPTLQWPYTPPPRPMTVELLLKLQRLVIGSFFLHHEDERPWYLIKGWLGVSQAMWEQYSEDKFSPRDEHTRKHKRNDSEDAHNTSMNA